MDDLNANEPRAGKMSDEIAAMHPGERMQLMFGITDEPPPWKKLADLHGITVEKADPEAVESDWIARIDYFGPEEEHGMTPQEAVNVLIFRLKL